MSMDSDHRYLQELEQASSLDELTQLYRSWRNWGDDDEVGDAILRRIAELRAEEMKPQLEREKKQAEEP
jgi:hypothetical protein